MHTCPLGNDRDMDKCLCQKRLSKDQLLQSLPFVVGLMYIMKILSFHVIWF